MRSLYLTRRASCWFITRDYQREMKRREDVLNEAADRGIFLEEDMLAKEGGQ